MKKGLIIALLMLVSGSYAVACTNLLVGKKASTDGSVFVTYSADSYALFGELYHWPAAKYPAGSLLDVYDWDSGKFLGQIPQVAETYNVIGNMNEHQLCIGETTWGGREELQDPDGIIDYGSLIYITLQRAKTAREALTVMTDLVEKYGYYSGGESFSVADKNELWVLEMISKGPNNKGAVWVAVRIPDDCVSAHANQARIHQFPMNDPANCIYSKDVISFAKEKGYYKGSDKDFSFSKVYNPLDWGGLRACEARVWSFYNQVTDNAEQWIPYILGQDPKPMPLYVKANRLLSAKDMMDMMRDHYEGTVFDPTKDVSAGAFGSPYRFNPLSFEYEGKKYSFERPIATQQTAFTFVAQMRADKPDKIGGILWFGVDDAAFTIYNPMYTCMTEVPECYKTGNGDLVTFSWSSAFWIHNWVAQYAYSRYSQVINDTKPAQDEIENRYLEFQPIIEQYAMNLLAREAKGEKDLLVPFLTSYSIQTAENATQTWKKMGEYLLVKYMDGVVKKEENGKFIYNEYGSGQYPNRPYYNQEWLKRIVDDKGEWLEQREIKL